LNNRSIPNATINYGGLKREGEREREREPDKTVVGDLKPADLRGALPEWNIEGTIAP